MSCIKFMSFNLAAQPVTEYTPSSEDSFFPATNIGHDFTTKVWRTPEGTTSGNVIFDLKTIEDVDTILVVPNSVNGFSYSSLTIEANATPNFAAPAFSTTLTPNLELEMGIKTIATQSFRFWRITPNTAGDFVELSKVFIGKAIELANNGIDFGWTFENKDRSIISLNRYAQKYIDRINDQKNITASIKLMNVAEVETMLDIFEYHGEDIPIWIVINENETIINDAERFSGYFYFRGRPKIVNSAFGLYDTTFQLEEAL